MKRSIVRSCRLLAALLFAIPALARPDKLSTNAPTSIDGVETVCTGIGYSQEHDPRWMAYPLRVEVVGKGGQWLADADITLSNGKTQVLDVHCGAPWLLAKVPPGRYEITGSIPRGSRASVMAYVSATGQARAILRFPDAGGAVSQAEQ